VTEYLVTFAAAAKKELQDLPADVIERLIPKTVRQSASCRLQETAWL
jgi:hypothetical protein